MNKDNQSTFSEQERQAFQADLLALLDKYGIDAGAATFFRHQVLGTNVLNQAEGQAGWMTVLHGLNTSPLIRLVAHGHQAAVGHALVVCQPPATPSKN